MRFKLVHCRWERLACGAVVSIRWAEHGLEFCCVQAHELVFALRVLLVHVLLPPLLPPFPSGVLCPLPLSSHPFSLILLDPSVVAPPSAWLRDGRPRLHPRDRQWLVGAYYWICSCRIPVFVAPCRRHHGRHGASAMGPALGGGGAPRPGSSAIER